MSLIISILFIGIFNKYSYGNSDFSRFPLNDIPTELKSVSSAGVKSSCSDGEICSSNHIIYYPPNDTCDKDNLTCSLNLMTSIEKYGSSDVVYPSDKVHLSPPIPSCACGQVCCPPKHIFDEYNSTSLLNHTISTVNQDGSSNVIQSSNQIPDKSRSPPHILGCGCCSCSTVCCANGACCVKTNCLSKGVGCSP